MLALRGHLRLRLASRRAFRAAGGGRTLVWRQVTSPFRPNLGLGWSLPVTWVGSGVPSRHSSLQGQRAPGTGLGGAGATTTSSVPDLGKGRSFWETGHSFLATSVFLSLSLFFFFPPIRRSRGEGRSGPRTLSFVSGVIGDHLPRVPCAFPTNFSLSLDSGSLSSVWGVALKGSRSNGVPVTLALAWKGRMMGDGDSIFPSS